MHSVAQSLCRRSRPNATTAPIAVHIAGRLSSVSQAAIRGELKNRVQQALARLMAKRTVLMIAHRLATVRNADRIAVLERGAVIAVGTHDRLVRDSPLYARLAALQFTAAPAEALVPK